MSVDTIGDFLTVLRNALAVSRRSVAVPFSNMRAEIARVLKDEGYIKDFKKVDTGNNKADLVVYLKYVDGEASIHKIVRASTPGRRRYEQIVNVEPVIGGLGIWIMSTSKGIMSDRQARLMSVGGELLCSVW